jgi:hypothetical protein
MMLYSNTSGRIEEKGNKGFPDFCDISSLPLFVMLI